MKTRKWLVVVLAVALLGLACSGCAAGGSANYNVTVEVIVDGATIFGPSSVEVQGTEENPPTVLQCMKEAFMMNPMGQMTYQETDGALTAIGSYAEKTEGNMIFYWECSVNGEAQLRKTADSITVRDGDKISYVYCSVAAE